MDRDLGKSGDKGKAVAESLLGLLMFIVLFVCVVVLFEDQQYIKAGVSYALCVFLTLFAIDGTRCSYLSNPITITSNHLIVHMLWMNKKVYNLNSITRVWKIKSMVYLVHNGWPANLSVARLSNDERSWLIQKLEQHALTNRST